MASPSCVNNATSRTFKVNGQCITIQGHSVAARNSCFWVKELKVLFDAGLSCYTCPKAILVTHGHSDHSFMLPMILTGQPNKSMVVAPKCTTPKLHNHCRATYDLSHDDHHEYNPLNIIMAIPNDIIPIHNGLFVLVHKLDHTVDTCGYTILRERHKLKDEYRGLPSQQLRQMKASGLTLEESFKVPVVSYLLDCSTASAIETLTRLYTEYGQWEHVIILECTYLEEHHKPLAEINKHVHLDDIKDTLMMAPPTVTTILTHFTSSTHVAKYKQDIPNVIYWDA